MIYTEKKIQEIATRYLGIGAPLSNDEREILLMALYAETERNPDGIFGRAMKPANERLARQAEKIASFPKLPGRKQEVYP